MGWHPPGRLRTQILRLVASGQDLDLWKSVLICVLFKNRQSSVGGYYDSNYLTFGRRSSKRHNNHGQQL
jgi:hypothetical protein